MGRKTKNEKICISSFLLILILFNTVACNSVQEPKINIEAQVLKLSDKEYKSVETHELENPTRDNFHKFTLNLEIKDVNGIKDRKVKLPNDNDWKKYINSFDKERYWFGKDEKQINNEHEDAKYYKEVIFYSKGLTEDKIKSLFDSAIIEISWVSKEGKTIKKKFVISDLIEFDNGH